MKEHEAVWAARWAACDIQIDGDPQAQRALRFAAYHLNGAANPDDETVSIAARGLTGADYAGHVFWDTEIFLLPFFAHTWPNAARALLMYRFHTLDGARAKAARLGWRGALYAWESADTGAEVTPAHAVGPDRRVVEILSGTQEQHISADVAYAVWQYWTVTGDEELMRDAGVEILLETARFWASRATLEDDGRRHIRGVIGPDEYHDGIDDNAFTNVMARRNAGRSCRRVSDSMGLKSRVGPGSPRRSRQASMFARGCSSSSRGMEISNRSTWMPMPAGRYRWTSCSAANGPGDLKSSNRRTSSPLWRCCPRSFRPAPTP